MDLFSAAHECKEPYDLSKLVQMAPQGGLVLEFGVSTGSTLAVIARNTKDTVYGFDCWEGLPEDLCGIKDGKSFVHDGKGSFKGKPDTIPDNCHLVDGYFEDTVGPFHMDHEHDAVCFMHIDCDLYSSTKLVLSVFQNHFADGAIIAFDEFMDYAPDVWMHHEYKAFTEFLEDNPQYIAECIAQSSPRVAFRLKARYK